MDISQYASQALFGQRQTAQPQGGTRVNPIAVREVQPVQGKTPQTQQGQNTASDAAGGLFETLVDTVNPLQHIPGVGSVYREVTGDTANPIASMAGGFLFGGPVGLAAGAASSFLEMLTGKSLMGNAMALFSGADADEGNSSTSAQSVAANANGNAQSGFDRGVSLQQYQAFANATDGIYQGTGAKPTDVGWAENVWTHQALKQATGSYETSQSLGANPQRSQRTA